MERKRKHGFLVSSCVIKLEIDCVALFNFVEDFCRLELYWFARGKNAEKRVPTSNLASPTKLEITIRIFKQTTVSHYSFAYYIRASELKLRSWNLRDFPCEKRICNAEKRVFTPDLSPGKTRNNHSLFFQTNDYFALIFRISTVKIPLFKSPWFCALEKKRDCAMRENVAFRPRAINADTIVEIGAHFRPGA
jgi:hypothetical protein